MFPWLFPYGTGGIGSSTLSESEHIQHLLLYYDKRFQTDPEFSLIAYNHQNIKSTTTGSFLLAKNAKFSSIQDNLLQLNVQSLENISNKLKNNK